MKKGPGTSADSGEVKMRLTQARAWVSMPCRDQTAPGAHIKPGECVHLVKEGLEHPHLPAQGASKEAQEK